jgi:hypothetical protein
MSSYLQKRGLKYDFRRGIPLHFQAMLRKKETSTSLRTTDREEAKRRIPRYVIVFDKEIAAAQATLTQMGQAPRRYRPDIGCHVVEPKRWDMPSTAAWHDGKVPAGES